jgi:hypothetical protein
MEQIEYGDRPASSTSSTRGWGYFSHPDGLALEVAEIADCLMEDRGTASARDVGERPSFESSESALV